MRIIYQNLPPDNQSYDVLMNGVRSITSVDTDLQFRFIIRFIGPPGRINNFECKVYPYCTDDEHICLGTLHLGDREKMRHIKKKFNECKD